MPAAIFATLACAAAALGFGARLPGYSHASHPLALLGARGLPHATAFNLLAFVVPGMIVAGLAWQLRASPVAGRGRLGRWTWGIGAHLAAISALAFAAQGGLPLEAQDLDGAVSARHAAAWMLWWIGFAAGGVLLTVGAWRERRGFALATLVATVSVPLLGLVAPLAMPPGWAQRAAIAAWFVWAIVASGRISRSGS